MKIKQLAIAVLASTTVTAFANDATPLDSTAQCPPDFAGTTCKVITGDLSAPNDNITVGGVSPNAKINQNPDQTIGDTSISNGSDQAYATGGTNTAHGGTYTTGDLAGGSVGNTSTGASTSAVGNTTTGASTATNGDLTTSNRNKVGDNRVNTMLKGGNQSLRGGNQGQSSSNKIDASDNSLQSLSTSSKSNQNLASSNKSAVRDSGNSRSSNNIDASERSVSNYKSESFVQASRFHAQPITIPGAVQNTVVTQCSPIPKMTESTVYGTHIGVFRNKTVNLGKSHQVTPNLEGPHFNYVTNPDGSVYEMGVQLVITNSVNNVGSSRSVSLDIMEKLGKGGGGGASNSSAMQSQVSTVQAVPCVHTIYEPEPEPKVEPEQEDPKWLGYLQHGMSG